MGGWEGPQLFREANLELFFCFACYVLHVYIVGLLFVQPVAPPPPPLPRASSPSPSPSPTCSPRTTTDHLKSFDKKDFSLFDVRVDTFGGESSQRVLIYTVLYCTSTKVI